MVRTDVILGERILKTSHRKSLRSVSVWRINILPQMRKTFNETEQEELSENIRAKGVLNAPLVALFNEQEVDEYLNIINLMWNRQLTRADLKKPSCARGQRYWYVLLAGERRVRSLKQHVHLRRRSRMFQAMVHEHIEPYDAIDIQMSENTHRRVPPHEEAQAYAEYWILRRSRDPDLTLAGFARRIGRSGGVVRNALRFVTLPAVIRYAVAGEWDDSIPAARALTKERRRLPYGIGVNLARLGEAGFTGEQLIGEMIHATIRQTSVADFEKKVTSLIAEQGQTLLDLMSTSATADAKRLWRKRTVSAGVSRVLTAEEVWLAKVIDLFERGLIGREDSPFADSSVRTRLMRIAELYEMVYHHLYKRPSQAGKRRLAAVQQLVLEFARTGT